MSDPWVVREHGPIFHSLPGPFPHDLTTNNSSLINSGQMWSQPLVGYKFSNRYYEVSKLHL